jgi:hypothetical protein
MVAAVQRRITMDDEKGASGSGAGASYQGDIGAEIGERARATFDHAKEDARALADRAREAAISALDRQKAEAASQLDGLAQAFRDAAESLEKQHYGPIARYAGFAAENLGGIAEALNEQDLASLLNSAHRLARRQPALFVGGAVALGFGLTRFLKSSGDTSEPRSTPPASVTPPDDAAARPARAKRTSTASRAKPRGRSRPRGSGGPGTRARWRPAPTGAW